jgi:hypothetical protein
MARAFDAEAKAKRQKVIAAVGGVILVALLVWRVPPMIALMNKKAPPPPAAAVPAPAPTPGLPVAAGGAPSAEGELVDTDTALAPEDGQLVSFGRFVSKDPFAQQVGAAKADGAAAAPARPRRPIKVSEPELDVHAQPQPQRKTVTPVTAARISVNGTSHSVAVGATFPAADPIFKLVALGKGSAKIAIAGGSYASGAATHTLRKGEPVTLVNTADGTRYRLLLL